MTSAHHHHEHDPGEHRPAEHRPAETAARAERICAARGLRLTPVRRRVLDALSRSARPLGAYDLAGDLSAAKRLSAVSVYRALEFLEEAGLIHRLSTRPAYVVCSHDHASHEATIFLVCEGCGRVDEVASADLESGLSAVAHRAGFTPHRRAIEVEGRCAGCRDGAVQSV